MEGKQQIDLVRPLAKVKSRCILHLQIIALRAQNRSGLAHRVTTQ
jgi:hypothetical protein